MEAVLKKKLQEMGNSESSPKKEERKQSKLPPRELGVQPINEIKVNDTRVVVAQGSVIDFQGDVMVNAANNGCISGGGVDGAISSAGGDELHEARLKLPVLRSGVRCETGGAKLTIGGELNTKLCIHAVGPSYSWSKLSDSELDSLLYMAYMESMKCAKANECKTIGFSLLSAGIFRGHRPLGMVLTIGLRAIMDHVYEGLEAVYMVGYMRQECSVLYRIVEHFHENKKLPDIELETDPQKIRLIQIKNIKNRIDDDEFIVGDRVRLQEIESEDLCGQVGEIIGFNPMKKKWRVKVTDKKDTLRRILLPNGCLEFLQHEVEPEKKEEIEEEVDAADGATQMDISEPPKVKDSEEADPANDPSMKSEQENKQEDLGEEAKEAPVKEDTSVKEDQPMQQDDANEMQVDDDGAESGKKRVQENLDENSKRAKVDSEKTEKASES